MTTALIVVVAPSAIFATAFFIGVIVWFRYLTTCDILADLRPDPDNFRAGVDLVDEAMESALEARK